MNRLGIKFSLLAIVVVLLSSPASHSAAPTREEKVRNDLKSVPESGLWIYNDLAKGQAEARRTGKPLLVVLRCVP